MDRLSPENRSRLMSRVGARDTAPEMTVRRCLHRDGYRYRLHRRDLPGTPDLVFPSRRKVVFVHGCFWHRHSCPRGTVPSTNTRFWERKLNRNRERDAEHMRALRDAGWAAAVVWECELRADSHTAIDRLRDFLGPPGSN